MCGIAGFDRFTNYVELAHAANKIQQHRGPDKRLVILVNCQVRNLEANFLRKPDF